jgi:hypothetical protein
MFTQLLGKQLQVYKTHKMALLIRKTDNLRKADGSEIAVDLSNPNDGILIRFMPQGQFKGFAQNFFLEYYTKLQFDQEGFGSIGLVKYEDSEMTPITNKVSINRTFQEMMTDYNILAAAMPQLHPLMIFAYGYHNYIKQALEDVIGVDSVVIRLDLM